MRVEFESNIAGRACQAIERWLAQTDTEAQISFNSGHDPELLSLASR